jgi:phosphatidylinositol-3-phosphatase
MIMSLVKAVVAGLLAASAAGAAVAAEGPIPSGIPHLDHVFVIMMENHSFGQVVGNPAMPFVNGQINGKQVNLARSYYAVGHPSLTNYLEIVGGSNFGVRSDNAPDWHNANCQTNLQTGVPNADNNAGNAPYAIDTNNICPIWGVGTDAVTEPVDNWNEVSPPVFNYLANIDGMQGVPAARGTVGKTIADQLALWGMSWKSYQEDLPVSGADLINSSNGTATNATTYDATKPLSATNLPMDFSTSPAYVGQYLASPLLAAYAVKHNPFAYFRSVQEGSIRGSSLNNIVGFDGVHGLYADLASGNVPTLAFIAPNQCDDQHGRGNGDAFCEYDQGTSALGGLTNGTMVGLNPGLSEQADTTVNRIVSAITGSDTWRHGYNAIVVVWDENDYSGVANQPTANTPFPAGNLNNVVLTVQTNSRFAPGGVASRNFYDSFSLLKSLEAGLRLPCLNHACDSSVKTMSDLFGPGF